jgi:hypothetical protein
MMIKMKTVERVLSIRATLRAAEQARCACGDSGSWEDDDVVYGTSGCANTPVIWAGCPNCTGSAVGRPVKAADLAWYQEHASAYAAQIEMADAVAAARRLHPDERDSGQRDLEYPADGEEVYSYPTRGGDIAYEVPLRSPTYGTVARIVVVMHDGEIKSSRVIIPV